MYATDNTTFINGAGLAFTLLMGLLLLLVPRRQAMLPVIIAICFMTMGQRLMIVGLNFTVIRLLLLLGMVRVWARGEAALGEGGPIDRTLGWWVLASVIAYTLLWASGAAFVNRLGFAYDALGLFFLFRLLVRDTDDIVAVIRQFAWLAMPLALLMVSEKYTGRNPFAALGGVPPETLLREGVLRCQGPFAHPILAGAFGSALLPLFLGLRVQQRSHGLLATAGLLAAGVIVWTSGSSGPLLAAGAGMLGWAMFGLRRRMQTVRRAMLLGLVVLHFSMAAPVWFLLARVSIFDGSTGYHRAILVDSAIHHFFDWWLVGTYSTASWGYYLFDVTNQYVLIGVQGGLISLLLFVRLIARGFGAAGEATQAFGDDARTQQKLAWALGCSLLVHAVNYISVPYFDQNIVCWYLLLAMLATVRLNARQAAAAVVAAPATGRPAVARRARGPGLRPQRGEGLAT